MAFIRGNFIRVEVSVPAALHKRIKRICKEEELKIVELVRDAIAERVEFLEEKQRKKHELKAQQEEKTNTKFIGFRKMSPSNLATPAKPIPVGEKSADPTPVLIEQKEIPTEYIKHAEKIYAAVAGGSPLEARLCTAEAVAAIKKQHPLTHPKEKIIVETLEHLVLEMREASLHKTREEAPEIVIDTSKIRTFGSLE